MATVSPHKFEAINYDLTRDVAGIQTTQNILNALPPRSPFIETPLFFPFFAFNGEAEIMTIGNLTVEVREDTMNVHGQLTDSGLEDLMLYTIAKETLSALRYTQEIGILPERINLPEAEQVDYSFA